MRLVVADTGPLNYLILIDQIELLPILFDQIYAPEAVQDELRHADAPDAVRSWIASPPSWIEISALGRHNDDVALDRLDAGERAAIELAVQLDADLILIDERAAAAVARDLGFGVTGTLGVLDLAARRGLLQLDDALRRLKTTSFRCRPEIMEALLASHAKTGGAGNLTE